MTNGWLVCVPAYGRRLNTVEEIEAHWHAEKDFRIVGPFCEGGTYVNKRDALKHDLTVEVRFGKSLEKLHILNPRFDLE
jgi:hypothetical protein